jgi:hypothetical protein
MARKLRLYIYEVLELTVHSRLDKEPKFPGASPLHYAINARHFIADDSIQIKDGNKWDIIPFESEWVCSTAHAIFLN